MTAAICSTPNSAPAGAAPKLQLMVLQVMPRPLPGSWRPLEGKGSDIRHVAWSPLAPVAIPDAANDAGIYSGIHSGIHSEGAACESPGAGMPEPVHAYRTPRGVAPYLQPFETLMQLDMDVHYRFGARSYKRNPTLRDLKSRIGFVMWSHRELHKQTWSDNQESSYDRHFKVPLRDDTVYDWWTDDNLFIGQFIGRTYGQSRTFFTVLPLAYFAAGGEELMAADFAAGDYGHVPAVVEYMQRLTSFKKTVAPPAQECERLADYRYQARQAASLEWHLAHPDAGAWPRVS